MATACLEVRRRGVCRVVKRRGQPQKLQPWAPGVSAGVKVGSCGAVKRGPMRAHEEPDLAPGRNRERPVEEED